MNDIKERLMNGESADSILKDFGSQVAKAEREIEREKKKNSDDMAVCAAREKFVDATAEYMVALGVIDEADCTAQDKAFLNKVIAAYEEHLKAYGKSLDRLFGLSTPVASVKVMPVTKEKVDSDAVLRDFLEKSLV